MKRNEEKKEYIIDASGKSLGRLSTYIANILRGKNDPSFQPNTYPNVRVIVNNASKVKIYPAQLRKIYTRYSGYPGGLKKETMEHLIKRKGYRDIFEKAVRGMLPSNKLRDRMMKNLVINE